MSEITLLSPGVSNFYRKRSRGFSSGGDSRILDLFCFAFWFCEDVCMWLISDGRFFSSDGAGHPRKTISLWWPGQASLLVFHFGIYCIEFKIVTPTSGFLLFILFLKYTSLSLLTLLSS